MVLILYVSALHEEVGEDFLKSDEKQNAPEGVEGEGSEARSPAEKRSRDARAEDDAQRDQHARDRDTGSLAAARHFRDKRPGQEPFLRPETPDERELPQGEEHHRRQPAAL